MEPFDLDQPIFELTSKTNSKRWTARHAVEGVQIFGGIGSGKTSGSGRMLALKYLSKGFGGLVLTVKPDEKNLWQEYCQLTNRIDDLYILEPGGKHHFNFLQYESANSPNGEVITENLVEVLKTVLRAGKEKDSGKTDDAFWEQALDMLIFNVIDLCKLAYGDVSVAQMYRIAQSIPKPETSPNVNKEPQAFQKAEKIAREKVTQKVTDWFIGLSFEERNRLENSIDFDDIMTEAVGDMRLLTFVDEFFINNYIPLSEKTRSIIDFTFTGFLYRLLREPIYSLFCKNPSTLSPEDCMEGKIILINLPVKVFHKVGRDCQILFKYIWQRAMEQRTITPHSRPVFLWADEAQNFLHEHDADYQATARSSRIATVYISQNLPNYYACMGGDKAEYRVKSFLGTLGTKIFHANADIETNRYASDLIGDVFFEDPSESVTIAKDFSQTRGKSLKLERAVRPEEFVNLCTGGQLNNNLVEGYMHRQGQSLVNGLSYSKMTFNQNYAPQSNNLFSS